MLVKIKKYLWLLPAILVILITQFNIVRIVKVNGDSMSPTLHNNDFLLFTSLHDIRRDDVIVIHINRWHTQHSSLIKRVVAFPGDVVEISEESLKVNSKVILKPKDYFKRPIESTKVTLKADEYFILGDNYGHSYDSLARYIMGYDDFLIKQNEVVFGKSIENKNIEIKGELRQ